VTKFLELKKHIEDQNQNVDPATLIDKVLQSFYKKMSHDTMIGFFFHQKDLQKVIERQKEFLLMVFGYEKSYTGRSVMAAHMNLPPILEGHFNRRLVLLKETLQEFNFPDKAQQDWLGFEEGFRKVIVK
jgi:truncated hemoglobin YjbI